MNAPAQKVVEEFVSALERLNLDEALCLVAPDVRWVNLPWTTASNKGRFEKALHGMFKNATRFEVQYRDIHERGDGIVYTDRIDTFESGGARVELPVRGQFRVRDGLITEWVDRFSWLKLLGQIAKSLPGVLRHRLSA